MNTHTIETPQNGAPLETTDAEKETPAEKQNQLIKQFGLVEDDARALVTHHLEDVKYVLEKNPAEILFRHLKVSDASFITLPESSPATCHGLLMSESDQSLFKRTLSRGLFLVNTKQFKLFIDSTNKFLTRRGCALHADSVSFSGKPKTLIRGYNDLVKIANHYYPPNFSPSSFRIALCGNNNLKNSVRQSYAALGRPWLFMDTTMIPAVGLVMHEIMHTIGENHSAEPQDIMACNNIPYLVQNILSAIDVYDAYGNPHPILNGPGGTDSRNPVYMDDGTVSEVIPSDRGLVGYFFNNTIAFSTAT